MRNNRFDFRESTVDRYLREEWERADPFRNAFGGGAAAEAIRQVTERQKLLRGHDLDKPYRNVLDMLERDRKDRDTFTQLASTALAFSVSETARDIAARNTELVAEQRRFSGTVLDTIRTFDINRSAVATAIVAASASETMRRMVADALPGFPAFSAIAERLRCVDAAMLRTNEGVAQSATAMAAEMVLKTQRISEAIVAAPSNEASAELQVELFEEVLSFVRRWGPNTINELHNMGLFQWSAWLLGLIGFVLAVLAMQPSQSPQEKAAFVQLNQKIEQFEQERHRYYEAEALADEAYLSDLPRADLARDATLRRKPERAGDVVLNAPKGMLLAIEKAQGRWRLVVFRDPLSNQLARAWVYATAVRPLAPALEENAVKAAS